MKAQDISSTEWKKFILRQKNDEEIELWLAGVNAKYLFGTDIVAIACYEVPIGAVIIDIRREEHEYMRQGSTYSHPDGDRWHIILRIGDMTITKTIGQFHKTQSGTTVVLNRVWTIDHGKKPDDGLLTGINFKSS